jgi:hypothetical protein
MYREGGWIVKSLLGFKARAKLCRKFAKLEPRVSCVWLEEAERWSSLTREAAVMNWHEIRRSSSSAGPTTTQKVECLIIVTQAFAPKAAVPTVGAPRGGFS